MKRTVLFLSLIIAITFAACKKKETPQPAPQPADRGLFILNEGTFTYANSSLSYYDFATNTVENNLFFRVNNAPIGDVGQSLTLIGDD